MAGHPSGSEGAGSELASLGAAAEVGPAAVAEVGPAIARTRHGGACNGFPHS